MRYQYGSQPVKGAPEQTSLCATSPRGTMSSGKETANKIRIRHIHAHDEMCRKRYEVR